MVDTTRSAGGRDARAEAGPTLRLARRCEIPAFAVMDVLREANQRVARGEDIIHMEVGQPAFGAPRVVREAARRALAEDRLGYTEALGLPELRACIARHYAQSYGVDVPAGRVVVTTGSSAGFLLAFLALFDVGDRLAVSVPGYPCYRNIARALGVDSVPIRPQGRTRFAPVPADIEAEHARAALHGLLLASPANPTGTMLEPARLAALAECCRQHGLWLIVDEIYHGLTYGAPAVTALQFADEAVVINSFSKYFAMTGWRIGWMVVPEVLLRPIERLAQNLFIAPPTLSQHAACAAFQARDELEAHRQIYAQNRASLLAVFERAGLTANMPPPDGAFYLYVDISPLGMGAEELAERLLRETGIALTPGTDFDAQEGDRYLRFSYAGESAQVREAARRLAAWLPGRWV